MEQARADEKRIMICTNCDCEIYTCNECGESFSINQKIFCFDYKHLCEECINKKVEDEDDGE